MPLELRAILEVDDDEENKVFKLMGLNEEQFLRQLDQYKFMNVHNFSTDRQRNLRNNMEFSKEFFEIMDDDGEGGIELEELAQPLIALGLATDTGFVQKALKILNPAKFGQGKFEDSLTLKEFSRIFRTDPICEKLSQLIKNALDQESEAQLTKQANDNFRAKLTTTTSDKNSSASFQQVRSGQQSAKNS